MTFRVTAQGVAWLLVFAIAIVSYRGIQARFDQNDEVCAGLNRDHIDAVCRRCIELSRDGKSIDATTAMLERGQ